MAGYLHIVAGRAANRIEIEGDPAAFAGWTLVPDPGAPVDIGWSYDQESQSFTAPMAAVGPARAAAIARIDADADAVRLAVIGTRATEYQTALAQAQAFAAGGYSGEPPRYVKGWMEAKNAFGAEWSAQTAADDIIATGAAWQEAEADLRDARLLRKEQVRVAEDVNGIEAAVAAWASFLVELQQQLLGA